MVRIKRDTDDTETQGHAGSPDSCRGKLICLQKINLVLFLCVMCVTCHVTSCDGGVMLGPGWRGRLLMSAVMPGINTGGTL